MTQAREVPVTSVARPHVVEVTAVVVTRGATEYLPVTLAALAAQSTAPRRTVLVDAGRDEPAAVRAVLAEVPGVADLPLQVVHTPDAPTFGHAVRRALAGLGTQVPDGGWLWLLHDDSAPGPAALAELLRAVEIAPSVAVAGAKQVSWADPQRVLEVGLTTSRFGRRMTGLDEPEVDQGQHDGREDVLGVGLAGALVRRDVWDALGGPDPALGPFGDGLDLSRRARLAGHRVVVVPRAVVRHAQASHTGGRPGWAGRRAALARREAYLHSQLSGVPAALVPLVALLSLVSGLGRALLRVVTKEPDLAMAELAAPWAVLARPGRVRRARRTASATGTLRRGALRPLQVSWREVAGQAQDRRLAAAARRRSREAPSELELAELAGLRARRRGGLAVVLLGALGLTVATLGPSISAVVAGARLSGGGLALGDADLGRLWSTVTTGWVSGGLGSSGPVDPLLTALLPATAVLGSVGGAVAALQLGALVLAALGAWTAAGAATRSVGLRAWAALVWTGAPALLLATSQGRPGAVLAHVALPWVALGVARAVGVARIDGVASGLVGAQRVGAAPATAPVTPVVRTAEPSLAAAAGAGLAFVLVTAGSPVLLPAGLLALAVVAVVARPGRRLVWVALPAFALHGPTLAEAAGTWADGGWRLLLTDPAVVLPATGAPAWQQLLGWPVTPPPWAGGSGAATALALAAAGLVLVPALLALAAPRGGRAVRAAWLVVAVGLAAAVASGLTATAVADVDPVGTALVAAWPGGGVSLALLGALSAALVGAGGVRAAVAGHDFGWRQVGAAGLAALAVLGPALVLAGWTVAVRGGDLALVTSEAPVVPAVGVQMQDSADDVRVLALEVEPTAAVRGTLLRGDGVQLTELGRAVTARTVAGPLDATEPVPADAAETEYATAVARLVAGAADAADGLAALGVGAVLLGPGVEASSARTTLVGRLDSTDGLERVTETSAGVLWRVSTAEGARTTAWARLLTGTGGAPGEVLAAVPAADGVVDTTLAAATAPRQLVLAERADPGWRAWLDGRQLRAVETSWRQAFEVPAEGGRLIVGHVPAGRTAWAALQGAVLLVTVLLAVPVRRRRGVR